MLRKGESSISEEFDPYFSQKNKIEIPIKAKLYLSMLEDIAFKKNEAEEITDGKHGLLCKAFSHLSQNEQKMILLGLLKFIQRESAGIYSSESLPSFEDSSPIAMIEVEAQMRTQRFAVLTTWPSVKLKFNVNAKKLNIVSSNFSSSIDLADYLVFRSKKYPFAIVLEAISLQVPTKIREMTLNLEECIFAELYDHLFRCSLECQCKDFAKLLPNKLESEAQGDTQSIAPSDNKLVFLQGQRINQFLKYKNRLIRQLSQQSLQFTNLMKITQITENIRIQRSSRFPEIYRLETYVQSDDGPNFKKNYIKLITSHFRYLQSSQIIQEFSKRYQAAYERYYLSGIYHEILLMKEFTLTSDKEEVYFSRAISNIMSEPSIEAILIKVRSCESSMFRITVVCCLAAKSNISPETMIYFMREYRQVLLRTPKLPSPSNTMALQGSLTGCSPRLKTELIEKAQEQSFHTVVNHEDDFKGLEFVEADGQILAQLGVESQLIFPKAIDRPQTSQSSTESPPQIGTQEEESYITRKHLLRPYQSKDQIKMKEHYLFCEWRRGQNGGVISTNEEIYAEQKRLYKYVLTTMGSNILKGNGILNISLPVTIFKKESHLQSIAKDFCYAPMMFERSFPPEKNKSIERIKYALLHCLAVGMLGISMQKPFNPILGETMQAWIDGCPIYLQQISHHPPIGSYLFLGRGYQIHGQIEPKISIGMNSAKGFSDRGNFLIFDDGTTIALRYGKMIIKGFLYGERQFNYEEKIFAYDMTHNIFGELTYGPYSRGLFDISKKEPSDFVHGQIFRVKPEFKAKFDPGASQPYPTAADRLEVLSKIQGIWNDAIKFDNIQYFNFKTLPFDIVYESFPLCSDSHYRSDLINLIKGNIEVSQREKERMEADQRKDRNLREKAKKT